MAPSWYNTDFKYRQESAGWISERLVYIVRAIVDKPEAVRVETMFGEDTTVLNLFVDQTDFGKVIGKQGRNAKALRTILNGLSAKLKVRVIVELVDNERGPRSLQG